MKWVQNSVFEGELSRGEIEKIKLGLKRIINEREDSILLYKAHNKKWVEKEKLGIEKNEVTTII